MDSYRSVIPEFMSQTTLVDMTSHVHEDMAPKNYLQGQRRIDYVFASESLLPHMRWLGHIVILDVRPSDHVGIWMDFDGTELFRRVTDNLRSIHQKPFTMRDITKLKFIWRQWRSIWLSNQWNAGWNAYKDLSWKDQGHNSACRGICKNSL